MRYWPAGERCPHQVLVLFELLRFDLDTEPIQVTVQNRTAHCKDDTETTDETICMTPANSMNEKTCMSESMNEVISMAPRKNDTKPTNDKNAQFEAAESKNAEPANDEFKNIAHTKLATIYVSCLGTNYVPIM